MRAVVLRDLGSSDPLKLESVPDPSPGAGEAVVRLSASALNHRDIWIRKGKYGSIQLPAILGSDGVGVVEVVGSDGDSAWIGRRVVLDPGLDWGDDEAAHGPKFRVLGMPDDGTYAERIRVPVANLHDAPPHLSDHEAAALPLAGLTAYRALATRAKLRSGEILLVTGAGGGVSALAVPIARAIGARVIVTSRDDAKIQAAVDLGAEAGVNVSDPDWPKLVARLADGEGPHVVLDSVGGETLAKALSAVRRGGRIVVYGATTGPIEKFELTRLFWKHVDLMGTTMGSPREFAALLDLVNAHAIRPAVSRVFPLSDAAAAQAYLEGSNQFGKVVLDPAG